MLTLNEQAFTSPKMQFINNMLPLSDSKGQATMHDDKLYKKMCLHHPFVSRQLSLGSTALIAVETMTTVYDGYVLSLHYLVRRKAS